MALPPESIVADSPPQPIEVNPDGIPAELKRRPQWVNWKYVWDGKKWTKHPYNPRSCHKASSTDLTTWSAFEDVLRAYDVGQYDGLGFVFSSGDPYTGVDLDGCRNPETGEIERWAQEIIEALSSYTELSPSSRGVHILVKGKVPGPLKRDHIEVYSIERFFTLTGHAVDAERSAA